MGALNGLLLLSVLVGAVLCCQPPDCDTPDCGSCGMQVSLYHYANSVRSSGSLILCLRSAMQGPVLKSTQFVANMYMFNFVLTLPFIFL